MYIKKIHHFNKQNDILFLCYIFYFNNIYIFYKKNSIHNRTYMTTYMTYHKKSELSYSNFPIFKTNYFYN